MRILFAHFYVFVHHSYVTVHPELSTRQGLSGECSSPARPIALHAPSLALLTTTSGLSLFLLELNHAIDDELEDGYSFVTDVVDCVRTSRREILDTLRLCS